MAHSTSINQSLKICPVCDSNMKRTVKNWLLVCTSCGFLQSSLKPKIGDRATASTIDEVSRARALETLRMKNFQRILMRLSALGQVGGDRLLDVGCAHGWFLDAAAERGFIVSGLEPDPAICALAAQRGRQVWQGFFPEDLPQDCCFDVIVFNDVFEHLPDPSGAIAVCYHFLQDGGILVLNLPSSNGVFYRLSELLDRFGICDPLERMWQKQFPFPHLSYFNPDLLKHLVERQGFVEVHRSTLPSIELNGLWARLHYDRTKSVFYSALVWCGVVLSLPLIHLFPSDISLQMFCKVA